MKVFFSASLRGTQFYAHYYKEIYDEIEKQNHTHVDTDLFTQNRTKFYTALEAKGEKAFRELVARKLIAIRKADICVFEISMQSTAIGYLISKSLESHKPTIVLYLPDSIPHFFCGIRYERLHVCSYDEQTLKKVLKKALHMASEERDQRFNFFINTELLNYLEETAKEQNVSKSMYIRKLLETDMKKTTSFK